MNAMANEDFNDVFGDIFREKYVAAETKKHKLARERQPIQGETQARFTDERLRKIVSEKVNELADFVESLFLDQRETLERQYAAQIELLSKVVALVGHMQGASHAEPASLDNPIRATIDVAALDATVALRFEIDVLQRTVEEAYKLQAAPLAWIVGEMFNYKAWLLECCARESLGRRRCKVSLRKRRFGAAA